MSRPALVERFRARVGRYLPGEGPLVVAVSGGLDSTVLLHLLRFESGLDPARLRVAHFDHGLRPGSPADARWVIGLARAWGLGCETAAAASAPAGEAEARRLRYDFLDAVRARAGGDLLLTAHHADDQAETVLFRVLRGTGLRGLRGMAAASPAGRIRLLLPFWREELEAYARGRRLAWRTDVTNRDRARARNALRHEILPRAEALVAPGARAALVRLARNAARDEAAWTAAEDLLLDGVLRERASGRFVLALPALLAYHPAIRLRLVRRLARELGVDLDEAGTRVAMEFTSRGASGGGVHLSGRLRLRRSFDDLELARTPDAGDVSTARVDDDAGIHVPGPGDGSGEFRLGGRRVRARWGPSPAPSVPPVPAMPTTTRFHQAAFDSRKLAFPLTVRGARPGDRMRLRYGTKTIAKLLAEARVPRWERRLTTVLADADGRVLWVPGWARSVTAVPAAGHGDFHIGVEDAHIE